MSNTATEKRNIEANALSEEISSLRVTVTGLRDGKGVLNDVMNQYRESVLRIIDEQPTVDAVEVVRCKDCKHYDNSEGIQWCKMNSKFYPGGFDWHCFPEDGFCSYGEKK